MQDIKDPEFRARQHLLIQGFTLYTAEAAVALLLCGSQTLLNPDHAWAVEVRPNSWTFTDQLLGKVDSKLYDLFAAAAETCRVSNKPGSLLCTQGTTLLVPLDVPSVQGARLTIESAIMLQKQPPTEKLEAFSDDALRKEARKRGLLEKVQGNDSIPMVEARKNVT